MSTQLDWSSLEGKQQSEPVAAPQQSSQLDWSSLEGSPNYEVKAYQEKEGLLKASARNVLQPVLGALEMTTPGVIAGAWNMLGTGEALAELQEWEDGREDKLRKNFPSAPWTDKPVFNKEKYMEALQTASGTIPTVDNIASFIEKHTGLPLEAKTEWNKRIRLAGSAGKIRSGGIAKKATAAALAPIGSEALQAIGVPEVIANPIALGASTGVPLPKAQKVTKPSGMPTRWYESLKKDTKLSPGQYQNVKGAVESDIKKLTTDLIQKESSTARTLAEDPSFPSKINDTFKDVERLAENITETIPIKQIKTSFIKKVKDRLKGTKGISSNEFEQEYVKEANKLSKSIPDKGEASIAKSVEQYRKNNESFGELYEPGKSGAQNRAKREALLDYNRTIAETFEATHPDSEFNELFKYSNKKYSEIMDLENIDGFMERIFGEKINYKEANKFFRDKRTQRSFKNILGEDGFKQMEGIMKDFLPTEKAMSLLKKGEALGLTDMAKLGGKWAISPLWSKASAIKKGFKILRNRLLATPKFRITWESALKDLKKGNLSKANEGFKELETIEKQTYDKIKDVYQKIDKTNPSIENSKILDQILEVNPEYEKIQNLKEPKQFLRKSDYEGKNISPNKLIKREWDKYLNKDKYSKYYSDHSGFGTELGTVGDLITDPRLRKELKDSIDVMVYVDPTLPTDVFGQHHAHIKKGTSILDKNKSHIYIRDSLSPEQVRTAIAHEALHGIQYRKISKAPHVARANMSRGYQRHIERPSKKISQTDFDYYLRDLNEVNARKFERWVKRDVTKYRSTLEKSKMAKKLLEQQQKK